MLEIKTESFNTYLEHIPVAAFPIEIDCPSKAGNTFTHVISHKNHFSIPSSGPGK